MNGIDAIRTVFFSWLTLPAVHFLNTGRQRQSPGDCCIPRVDLHGFSLAPCVGSQTAPPHFSLSQVNLLLLNQKLWDICSFWMNQWGNILPDRTGVDPARRQLNCSCSTSLALCSTDADRCAQDLLVFLINGDNPCRGESLNTSFILCTFKTAFGDKQGRSKFPVLRNL